MAAIGALFSGRNALLFLLNCVYSPQFITSQQEGNDMKRTFFALALLVPAFASAAVTVDLKVTHADNTKAQESFEFEVGDKKVVTPTECGSDITMKLKEESDKSATFKVTVVQDNEVKCKSDVELAYGESHTFECEKACVGASVTMTASKSE